MSGPYTKETHFFDVHLIINIFSGPAKAVKVGMNNLNEIGYYVQTIEIAEIIDHPNYTISEKYNDITLYRLKSPMEFNEHVRPVCINTVPLEWNKAIAIGFGKTDYGLGQH